MQKSKACDITKHFCSSIYNFQILFNLKLVDAQSILESLKITGLHLLNLEHSAIKDGEFLLIVVEILFVLRLCCIILLNTNMNANAV